MDSKEERLPAQTRVALIPGGVRGIGRAIALALAERGWALALCYRKSASEAAETASVLRAKGSRVLTVRTDLSVPQHVTDVIRQVEREYGRIDALINCIG